MPSSSRRNAWPASPAAPHGLRDRTDRAGLRGRLGLLPTHWPDSLWRAITAETTTPGFDSGQGAKRQYGLPSGGHENWLWHTFRDWFWRDSSCGVEDSFA